MFVPRSRTSVVWIFWLVAVSAGVSGSYGAINTTVTEVDSLLRTADAVAELVANRVNTIRLRGYGLDQITGLYLTSEELEYGYPCSPSALVPFRPRSQFVVNSTELVAEGTPTPLTEGGSQVDFGADLYICVEKGKNNDTSRVHQGTRVKLKYKESEDGATPEVSGIRAFGGRVNVDETTGLTNIPADTDIFIQLFGTGFDNMTSVSFTTKPLDRGGRCEDVPVVAIIHFSQLPKEKVSNTIVELTVNLPVSVTSYYLCIKENEKTGETAGYIHQGNSTHMSFRVEGRFLPIYVQTIIVVVLLVLSGLFSGLNLGLMSLDKTELKVIESCGSPSERKCAKAIAPLRNHGNYLLCSLLLGNVLVNSTLTILLDDLTSGLIAVLGSTISIVIFGEIIPQAICSRHGLEIGARTLVVTKIFMVLTFPASYPISRILDYVLGEEIGQVYNREKLVEYIKLTMDYNQLANEEVNIISGALELKTKMASQIMTRIDDVFMLPYSTVLDFETVSNIIRQGYTRIPIFEGTRDTIVAVLNIKDLAFIDPADAFPLKNLCEFYRHPLSYCFEDQCLDELLDEFKKGKSHMSIVQAIKVSDDTDPTYQVMGIVTLEDVIEEILKIEIVDETDVLTDNRKKQKRKEVQLSKQDFTDFAKTNNLKSVIPAPLALATFQFLSTAVEPFKREQLSESVLRRLLVQNIFCTIKIEETKEKCIYKAGKTADYFALLLEGRAKVTHITTSNENMVYEAGSFSCFGIPAIFQLPSLPTNVARFSVSSPADKSLSALSLGSPAGEVVPLPDKPFIPDYNVEAITDLLYMRVHRNVYAAAYKASRLDKSNRSNMMETEWANVLNAVNSANHKIPDAASTQSSLGAATLAQGSHIAGTPMSSGDVPDSGAPLARNSDASISSYPMADLSPSNTLMRSPGSSKSVSIEGSLPSGSNSGANGKGRNLAPGSREANERALLLSGHNSSVDKTS